MSDFIEYRDNNARLEPAYPRQADSYAASELNRHRPSTKHSRRTQASYASNGTWIPYPDYPAPPTPYRGHSPGPTSRDTQGSFATWDNAAQQSYPPPPDAYRAPSPAMTARTRGRSEAGEPEFEYMDAAPGTVEEHEIAEVDEVGDIMDLTPEVEPEPRATKGRFVGGFFAGLKKLPKAVLRGRQPPVDEYPRFSAPQYEPTPHISYAPTIDPPADHRASSPPLSHHSSHRSQNRHDDAMSRANGDASSTAVHQGPAPTRIVTNAPAPLLGLASPNLRPTSDYDKMTTPPRTPTAPSITSYLTRVHRFLKTLSGLPWVAPSTGRVAIDYFPGENPRSRYLYPRYREREQNRAWYTSKHKDVDLLSGDIPLQSRRTTRTTRTTFDGTVDTHHQREHSTHQPHRSRTQRSGAPSTNNPARRPRRPPRSYAGNTRSYTSGSYSLSRAGSPIPPMPFASPSHSHLAFMDPHHHAQVSYPYGYTYSPSPPQPMYLIPGPAPASGNAADGQQLLGKGEGQGQGAASPVQAVQPAMPVYLVAGLPPQPMAAPGSPIQRVRSGGSTPRAGSPKSR
ncbi:hypothetical protein OE88DRAFT_1658944 [Heliocybe sulcata]|uniref:Uncharacterized protein n=1 Tax=Heliocybe sulcata TaxID=5364 RepID=A0A5C3N3B4_9AGAM|nr:hypothetical protein OE88DRAFT_1658944 [Heliocybe sulcata]